MKQPLVWAFQKDSEFAECFSYHLLKMREGGQLHQLLKEFSNIQVKKDSASEISASVFDFKDVAFPSIMLLFGLALALLQALMEFCWGKVTRKHALRRKPITLTQDKS